jgi:hypothetical protein
LNPKEDVAMAAEWHYGESEPSEGPVSMEELKQLVASGQVQPTWMVWRQGMPEWLPAGEVEDLFPKQTTAGEPTGTEEPLPVPPEEPAGVAPAPSGRLHAAAIGAAALCVVGLVVAGTLLFFHGRQRNDKIEADLPGSVKTAMATLKTNPADPEANLVVGKYCCFQQDDWDKGLPMLAQGSDTVLKDLATEEMSKPTVAGKQKELGNRWWKFAGADAGAVWKGSLKRAVLWYQQALPSLHGEAKTEVEKKLKHLDEQPGDFEIVTRRTNVFPDETHGSARSNNLLLEARLGSIAGPGGAAAGLELKGVRFLDVELKASSGLKRETKNSFAGFMVDYHAGSGYARRVALSIGVFDKSRGDTSEHWGKNSVPDEYVDLGNHELYHLDLQQWAPAEWNGQVWFTLKLQRAGADTFVTAQLIPLAKQETTGVAGGKEKPSAAPSNPAKGKKGKKKHEGT